MTSEIRSNTLKNRVGLGTVSFTNTGPVVSGIVTANTFRLPDSTSGSLGRLQLGNGLDLSLYHNGSNSFLVNNTGYLSIQSQDGVNGIFIARNAEVNLYFGSSVRLQTSSSGVTINRDLDVDGHTNLDNVSVAGIVTVTNTLSGIGLKLVDASNKQFMAGGGGGGTPFCGSFTGHDFRIQVGGVQNAIFKYASGATGNLELGPSSGIGITFNGSTGNAGYAGIVTASQGLRVPNGSATTNYISVGNNGALRFWGTTHQFADIRSGNLHFRNNSLDNVLEIQQDKDIWMYGATYTLGAARFDSTVTMADSLIHFGDTDTKIRFPANDTFTVETAGSERLRVTSNGIIGAGGIPIAASASNGVGNAGTFQFYHVNTSGNNAAAGKIQSIATGAFSGSTSTWDADLVFSSVLNSTETERLRITSDGKVGIGTNNPGRPLTITAADPRIRLQDSDTGGHAEIYTDNSHHLYLTADSSSSAGGSRIVFQTDGANERARIDNSGNFTFYNSAAAWNTLQRATASHFIGLRVQETNGTQRMQFGVAGTNNHIVSGSAQHDVVLKAYDANLILATNATDRLRINSSGHLSLGGSNVTDVNMMTINGTGQTQNIGIVFNKTNSPARAYGINVHNGSGDLIFFDYTVDAERLRIATTGKISIGTQNVTEGILQVNGDVTAGYHHGGGIYGMLAKRKFDGTSALGGYAMRYASGYESPWIVGYNAGTGYDNQITFGSMTTSDRSLATGVQKRMVIDMASGFVGISSASPVEKFDVSGSINAGGETAPVLKIHNEQGNKVHAFKHYFDVSKGAVSGSAANRTLVAITMNENFHQAVFEVTYGTRLQAVSDSHTRPNKVIFGVNRFNGGNSINVTKTVIEQHSDASSHCDVNIVSISATVYHVRLEFSSTPNVSSGAGGWVEGCNVLGAFFHDVNVYYGVRN